MAVTSGSCYSSYARNTRFRIDWERTGTWSDSSGCGSIIRWKLVLENGNQWYSNAIKCYAIYINGSKVHDGNTWSNYTSTGTYTLIDWQSNVRIAHNNAGNEKTFNINYSGWFYSSYNVSASTDFTLPSIPRYTTITTFTVEKRNSNSFKINWGTSDTVNKVEYSTNNGSSFTNAGVSEGTSGNFTISGLSPSTSYSCKIRVTRKDSGLTTTSNTVTQSTYAKPTQSLRSKTETTIAMNWSCDTTANYLWYSTNGGSSWVAVGSVNATSGYYTISGLSPATTYNVATKIRRSANNIEDATTSGNQKTYAVPTQTFKSKTETTVTMQWNCDSTVDYVWYSTNNGSSWTAVGSVNATSGTYTITGLSAGGTYNIKTRVRRKDTQTTYDTAVNQQITFSYPYCKTAPDFTIGNNVTLTFYNPLNRDIQLQMWSHVSQTFINSTRIPARPADGANYTFPASDYKDNLYATIPNNQSSKYNIDVWYGSNKAIKEGGNYTVNASECVPTFPDFAYKDTTDNLLTQAIDDDQVIVQNVSNVNVVISSANKMVARKSATESKYAATFSNLSNQNIPYSESDIDTNLGVPTGKGSQTFRVIAYDSRNLSAEKIKTIDVKEYFAPIVNVSLERLNNFEEETHLTVAGNFAKVTVNDVDRNAIEQVRYRFKEQGGSFGSWNTMTIQSQGSGSYRTTQATETCDNTKQFIFEIEVTDRAKTTTVNQTLSIGQPLMFLHTNGNLELNGPVVRNWDNSTSYTMEDKSILYAQGSTDGFRLTYGIPSMDKGVTKLYTVDDGDAELSLGNYVSNTYKEAIKIMNGSASIPSIEKYLTYYNDTSASGIQELLRNKISQVETQLANVYNGMMFLNGGWSGVNYAMGIGSKIGTTISVMIIFNSDIYVARKYGGEYSYSRVTNMDWNQTAKYACTSVGWKRVAFLTGMAGGSLTIMNPASDGTIGKITFASGSGWNAYVVKDYKLYTNSQFFTQARIVRKGNETCYLELYQNIAESRNVSFKLSQDTIGTQLYQGQTAGSQPSGYDVYNCTF